MSDCPPRNVSSKNRDELLDCAKKLGLDCDSDAKKVDLVRMIVDYKKSTKPSPKKSKNPSYKSMILKALEAEPKKGLSRVSIFKYIYANYYFETPEAKIKHFIKKALEKLLEEKLVVTTPSGGKFIITTVTKTSPTKPKAKTKANASPKKTKSKAKHSPKKPNAKPSPKKPKAKAKSPEKTKAKPKSKSPVKAKSTSPKSKDPSLLFIIDGKIVKYTQKGEILCKHAGNREIAMYGCHKHSLKGVYMVMFYDLTGIAQKIRVKYAKPTFRIDRDIFVAYEDLIREYKPRTKLDVGLFNDAFERYIGGVFEEVAEKQKGVVVPYGFIIVDKTRTISAIAFSSPFLVRAYSQKGKNYVKPNTFAVGTEIPLSNSIMSVKILKGVEYASRFAVTTSRKILSSDAMKESDSLCSELSEKDGNEFVAVVSV